VGGSLPGIAGSNHSIPVTRFNSPNGNLEL
jgi:hypothetical protein